MTRTAIAVVTLVIGAIFGASTASAGLVQIDFGGTITLATEPEYSPLDPAPSIGDPFTGHFSFDEADVTLVEVEDGFYYKVPYVAPLELSFGGLVTPLSYYSVDVGDGSPGQGDGEFCTSPCDMWTLRTIAQFPIGLPPISFLNIRFEDQSATQINGPSFLVPSDRADWSSAKLEIVAYGELQAVGNIDTWHAVPEPEVTALAAIGLVLFTIRSHSRSNGA